MSVRCKHSVAGMKVLILPVILLVAAVAVPSGCEVYYVQGTSPDSAPCPAKASPCLTLQEYVNQSSRYLPENITDVQFRFLSGEHLLSKPFEVKKGRNIALQSAITNVSVVDNLGVDVTCAQKSYFLFMNSTSVSLHGIAFHKCGVYVDEHKSNGALTFYAVKDVCVQGLKFLSSEFADILATQSSGYYNMSDIIIRSVSEPVSSIDSHIYIGVPYIASTPHQIIFNNISLLANARTSGIVVSSNNMSHDNASSIALRNVTISGHIGKCGANLAVPFSVTVVGCNFTAGGSVALCLTTGVLISVVDSVFLKSKTGLEVFTNNVGEALSTLPVNFLVSNCCFSVHGGAGALVITGPISPSSEMTLVNLHFLDNNSTTEFNIISGIIILADLPLVYIEGVHFHNNKGTPLLLINTTVSMSGENFFIGNQAVEGGGMAFIGSSTLELVNNTLMVFRDNNASNVGGAWYVSSEDVSLYPLGSHPNCFIDISPPPTAKAELDTLNITVQFINNTARNGGNVLYGGNIDLCTFDRAALNNFTFGSDLLSEGKIFTYEPDQDLSRMVSAPSRVCLCEDGVPNCKKFLHNMETKLYPGQSFNVSVVTVGQQFGVVNGTVYAQLLPLANQTSSEVESLQQIQRVGQPKCTSLSYSVQSRNRMETLVLTTSIVAVEILDASLDRSIVSEYNKTGIITHLLLSMPVFVNVSILECPPGFIFSEDVLQCDCDPIITNNSLSCDIDIDNGTVKRFGTFWVSFFTNQSVSTQSGVVVSRNCPNGYCIQDTQHINLEDPDVQCNFNRSGILCGGCSTGMSLALGSDQCLKCSNGYITLLIPFAISGLLLVLLIYVLDLTITVGTINGIIFYANVVKSYQQIFLVPDETNILTVFISWLNLDLGIETCFFDGLDGYTKTWLQFAFPIYLWVLAGAIILLSRYYKWFAILFSRNAVPVLATLFMLSFNKLFQIAITAHAFSFVTLYLPDGSTHTAWKFDASIEYLSPKHIILFISSLLIFIFTGLPYLLVLLFYQCLLHVNHKRGFRWVFKLKPFLDANVGPLKDKHLYWIGILLLSRAFLILMLVVISSDMVLIFAATVSLFLIFYSDSLIGHVYKNWILSVLENSFFVNIAVLSVTTYYSIRNSSSRAPVIYTSISIAFMQFIGIVCYHCYRQALKVYEKIKERRRRDYVEIKSDNTPADPITGEPDNTLVSHSEVAVYTEAAVVTLREPLLDD